MAGADPSGNVFVRTDGSIAVKWLIPEGPGSAEASLASSSCSVLTSMSAACLLVFFFFGLAFFFGDGPSELLLAEAGEERFFDLGDLESAWLEDMLLS